MKFNEDIAGEEGFIIRKPKPQKKRQPIGAGGGPPIVYSDEYLDDDDRERSRQDISAQISSTISEVNEKPMHDDQSIFFRIDLANNLQHPRTRSALELLSANILAYLDEKQTQLFVEAPPASLSSTK